MFTVIDKEGAFTPEMQADFWRIPTSRDGPITNKITDDLLTQINDAFLKHLYPEKKIYPGFMSNNAMYKANFQKYATEVQNIL